MKWSKKGISSNYKKIVYGRGLVHGTRAGKTGVFGGSVITERLYVDVKH